MKVIISGYGRMGHMVEKELARRGIELVAASEDICSVDPAVARECVVIDFTWPDAFRANYPFIAKHFKAAVVGTTGWNDIEADVFKAFEEAGTPLIYASNFSLGVNALFAAVERVSKMLKGNGYTRHGQEPRQAARGRPRRGARDYGPSHRRSPRHPHGHVHLRGR